MRRIGWISTVAAVAALAACDAPETDTADAETSEAEAADTAPVIEPVGPTDAVDPSAPSATPSQTPTASEDGRPPLDNSNAQPTEGSCLAELGRAEAEALSEQCYAMSPATRPPCNIQNSCERIREELKRGCEFGDTSENPDYCSKV